MDYKLTLLLLFSIVIFFAFFILLLRSLILLHKFKNLPGPGPRLPLIGNLLSFYRPGVPTQKLTQFVFFDDFEKYKNDGLVVFFFGSKVTIFLLKAEYVECFKDYSLIDKPNEYNILKCLIGNSLVLSNGINWKNKKRLWTPKFRSKILDDYITAMNEESFKLTRNLIDATMNAFVDIRPLMSEITLNIIAKTALGLNVSNHSKEFEKFGKCFSRISQTAFTRFYNPLNWYDFIFYRRSIGKQMKKDIDFILNFTKNVINERRKDFKSELQVSSRKQMAFLDLLLTHQSEDKSITDQDVIDEIVTFLIAAEDTVSSCLTWTLFLLGIKAECQEKLIKEINSIFGNDIDRNVSKDDLQKMHYTECVIKESLRLYPPVPFIGRVTNTDIKVGGHKIPKGTSIFASTLHVQKDKEIFSNPFEFIPERFENQSTIHTGFMPFALGQRMCIGQRFAMLEMKIILAHIFRNFTIRSMDKECDIEVTIDMTLKSVNPIRISFIAID